MLLIYHNYYVLHYGIETTTIGVTLLASVSRAALCYSVINTYADPCSDILMISVTSNVTGRPLSRMRTSRSLRPAATLTEVRWMADCELTWPSSDLKVSFTCCVLQWGHGCWMRTSQMKAIVLRLECGISSCIVTDWFRRVSDYDMVLSKQEITDDMNTRVRSE